MRFARNVRPVMKVPQVRARRLGANPGEGERNMLGRAQIANCLAAQGAPLIAHFAMSGIPLLLLWSLFAQPALAQSRYTQPQSQPRSQSHPADGQWHHFGKEGGSNTSRPGQAHPPQNQPGHAGNWLRRYKDLPSAQQPRALENDPQFRKLSPQQQARLRSRLQHFSSLPPQQQEHVLNRMETWEHLTPDQKQSARQVFDQFKQLPPDRRQAVNRAIREMRGLTPDQRDQLINSQQYRNSFSLQERVILSGAAHLPLAPGDGLQTGPPE